MRSLLFLIACAAVSAPALAVDRDDLLSCAAISDDGERLACYDKLSVGEAAKPAPPPKSERDFGKPATRPEAPEEIVAGLSRFAEDAYGKLVFTLDNGQIWKQADFTHMVLRREEDRRVVINRNASGAYWLELEGGSKRIRVTRVR